MSLNVKNVFKTAGIMVAATLLAKVMGMFRDVLVANLYGTGDIAQAFSVATRIPLLFFDIALGTAISAAFIPVFNEYMEKGERENAIRYSNLFVTLIFAITVVICLFGILFSQQIVGLIAPGYEEAVKALASKLVIILFPTMIFTALAYALSGVLQSFGEFNIPAAISLVSNGLMVGYLVVFGKRFGIEGVAVAMLVGWSFQVFIQLPSLKKKKYSYRPRISLRDPGIRKTAKLALPILVSSWVQPINSSVNMILASGLNGGQAVPALDYANKLYIIFVGVLTYAISNLIFPSISRMAAGNEKDEFRETVKRALMAGLLLIIPVMVLFLILRTPIIQLVYQRGAFDETSTALTAKALLFYSLGMAGFTMSEILNKAFYALHDGKTPMVIAVCGITINIALSLFLVWGVGMELEGVAVAASIASTLIGLSLLVVLNKKIGLVNRRMFWNLLKIAAAAVVMFFAAWFTAGLTPEGVPILVKLVLPSLAGGIVYLALVFALRVDECMMVADGLKKRLKKV